MTSYSTKFKLDYGNFMFSWRDTLPTEPIQLGKAYSELHTHTSNHAKFQLNRFSPSPVHSSGELQERKNNKDVQTDMYEHLDPLCEQGVQRGIINNSH